MSRASEKTELSPLARKLIEQHAQAIDRAVDEASRKLSSPASVLQAACSILNLRARDVGAAGEHFSVHEYQGIEIIDVLDERRLRGLRALLAGYVERTRRKLDPAAAALLADKLTPGVKELPQYPVGYMVHYMLVSALQAFEPLVEQGYGFEPAVLELAMLHHLLAILDRYVQTRERPVVRHFSDVAREYSVVHRLKCPCGAEKYDVRLQALCQGPSGEPFDRLDLQCQDCGAQRSITFDLPHFRDMLQI